jgi:peptidoglycan lytic transglycosylase A|tara:strand:- start:40681 stop:41877 length:1197 start_codon:yes stop_codon:yes gene_type:complete
MRHIYAPLFLLALFATSLYFLVTPTKIMAPEKFVLRNFEDLEGWSADDHALALKAFQISCERVLKYPPARSFGDFGQASDWQPTCRAAMEIDPVAARKFFESHFAPLAFLQQEPGLFTGYYAPVYQGSRTRNDKYNAPLYMVPTDLQNIDLGDFDQSLKGRSIIGEVRDSKFVPYKDRAEIEQGALENKDLELVWLETVEQTFFLQIQGSGFIELENGQLMHLGYAERNGRPYRAIGQFLIESGDIAREDMSLQAILDWMMQNPEKSNELMWKNPSYVFFLERNTDKPVGSLGVGLTPGRSLAVDRAHIPLGVPLWLNTYQELGTDGGEIIQKPHLKRLVVAQDTGGAIKGQIRGDVYWGIGDLAELKAGPMKDRGSYYVLVPNTVSSSIFDEPESRL